MNRAWIDKYKKRIKIAVQLFLFTLALVLILVASQLDWKLITFAIGTSMMASVIISIWQSLLGTDPNALLEDRLEYIQGAYQLGLNTIHLDGLDNSLETQEFENAYTLDFMYNTGRFACTTFGQRIMKAIELHGCKVRLLLANPSNPIWAISEVADGLCPSTNMPRDIEEAKNFVRDTLVEDLKNRLPLLRRGSVEIRYYPCIPTSSIIIVNGSMIKYTPYLPYTHAEYAPVYMITRDRKEDYFRKFQESFEKIWNKSNSVYKVEWPIV